ncbi:MAG TPA: hypothetical protein VHA30_00375 [Patescibacteria group bacterium]|nr:hypothetical protein [Patescibacteria group bacterium]
MINFLKTLFNFREQKRQLLHIVLAGYLASYFTAHLWSLFVGNSIYIKGYQIHHFYFGTTLLAAGGLLGLLSDGTKNLRLAAALIGIGLGLFADEIGLLLNCTTRYHSCAYAFPDSGDWIAAISVALLLIFVLLDLNERSARKKRAV